MDQLRKERILAQSKTASGTTQISSYQRGSELSSFSCAVATTRSTSGDAPSRGGPAMYGCCANAGELLRYVLGRENEVRTTCGYGATWHRVIFGRIVLSKCDSSFGLYGLQSHGAVSPRARKNNSDGPLTLVLCERFKKRIIVTAALASR